jgi:hypothetical protein
LAAISVSVSWVRSLIVKSLHCIAIFMVYISKKIKKNLPLMYSRKAWCSRNNDIYLWYEKSFLVLNQ